jgi:hypothetical protein
MPIKTKALICACATVSAILLIICALPQTAAADDDPPGRVAQLSFLQGAVSFQPAGETDWVGATINRPMTTGDRLWADMDSRAELHIGSAAIRLSSNTGFSFLNLDDRTVQIQLSAGTLAVRVRRLERDEVFEIDTPNQAFTILRPGEYRLEASEDGNSTIVTVTNGKGEATGAGRTYTIESRERASLTGTDVLSADIDRIDRRDRDDFDEWCDERDHREDESRSARYVAPDMVGYEDLDGNGVWRHDPEYGDVWTPTVVPVGWAPYHYGHWAWIAPWGWTWVDDAPWGFAPFHYGRWAYGRGAWFWVPGPVAERPVYAPALVAFVGGPNFAVGVAVGGGVAVGWFPLGPREVYVPAYRTSPAYMTRVNVTNTNVSQTTVTNVYNTTVVNNNTTVVNNVTYVNRTAPGAVTAVPANAFASSQSVATAAVAVNQSQLRNAPVTTRAAVAPTQNSVLGHYDTKPGRPIPPGLANRPVVAKTTPPPPPVSFARQQQALAAHPGQPLQRNEVENLRPAEAAHPAIRPASPNQGESPNRGAGQVAGAPNGRPDNPSNGRGVGPDNRPANYPAANMPPRDERPEVGRPENRPAVSETPNAQPAYRPGQQNRPDNQPDNRPDQRVNAPSPAAPTNRPNVQPSYRPPSPENRGNPASLSNERPELNNRPQSAPSPEPSNNRQSNTQPIYRPLAPSDRPNANSPSNERPSINNEPANRPTTAPSNGRPSAPESTPRTEPSYNRPANAPPPQNRTAAPAPQAPGNVRAVPENRAPAPRPAPATSKNPSGNSKDKDKEKKN